MRPKLALDTWRDKAFPAPDISDDTPTGGVCIGGSVSSVSIPSVGPPSGAAEQAPVRLIVVVVVDQLRADLLDRYGDLWGGRTAAGWRLPVHGSGARPWVHGDGGRADYVVYSGVPITPWHTWHVRVPGMADWLAASWAGSSSSGSTSASQRARLPKDAARRMARHTTMTGTFRCFSTAPECDTRIRRSCAHGRFRSDTVRARRCAGPAGSGWPITRAADHRRTVISQRTLRRCDCGSDRGSPPVPSSGTRWSLPAGRHRSRRRGRSRSR